MTAQVLAEVCQSDNLMEQLAARAELEDNVVVLPRLRKVIELDNIRMVELAHDLNLLEDVCSLIAVHFVFAHHLNRNLTILALCVSGPVYIAKGAVAHLFEENVTFQPRVLGHLGLDSSLLGDQLLNVGAGDLGGHIVSLMVHVIAALLLYTVQGITILTLRLALLLRMDR